MPLAEFNESGDLSEGNHPVCKVGAVETRAAIGRRAVSVQ